MGKDGATGGRRCPGAGRMCKTGWNAGARGAASVGARRCGGRTPLESLDCSNGAGSGGAGALLCTAGTHGAALKLCSRGCRCSSGVLWTTRTEIPERVGERGLGGAGRWERRAPLAPPVNGGAFLCGTALGGCGCASSLLPHWLHVYAITLCTAWHVWQHICRIAENREKFAHRARQRFADVQKRLLGPSGARGG